VVGAAESVAAPRNTDQTNPKKNASLAISTDVQSLTPPELATSSTEERPAHYELRLHTGGGPNRDQRVKRHGPSGGNLTTQKPVAAKNRHARTSRKLQGVNLSVRKGENRIERLLGTPHEST
jgi:hypothetical protein